MMEAFVNVQQSSCKDMITATFHAMIQFNRSKYNVVINTFQD